VRGDAARRFSREERRKTNHPSPSIPCILIFIFLAGRKSGGKMEPPFPLQGEGRRRARERATLAGSEALRGRACSASVCCSELEPLPERSGLQPARLVSEQV
jgi:hypothetical protein